MSLDIEEIVLIVYRSGKTSHYAVFLENSRVNTGIGQFVSRRQTGWASSDNQYGRWHWCFQRCLRIMQLPIFNKTALSRYRRPRATQTRLPRNPLFEVPAVCPQSERLTWNVRIADATVRQQIPRDPASGPRPADAA